MEVVDKYGDLIAWFSDDLDDYLSVLLPEAVPELAKELNEIRYWSICRKNSMHPDGEGDEDEYLSEYGPRFIDAHTYIKYDWSNEQCCAADDLKWWVCYFERNGLLK